MPRGFHSRALPAVALLIFLAASCLGQVYSVGGEPLLTLEYLWVNQVFTPLDTTQSDTIFIQQQSDSYDVCMRFYRCRLPTPTADCHALQLQADATLLGGDQPTGLQFQLFPLGPGEAESFSFTPNTFWGQYYTYGDYQLNQPMVHTVPPAGTEAYNAWLLDHERPDAVDIIVGLRTFPAERYCVRSLTLVWDTNETSANDAPVPLSASVGSCYPNPFNASTAIPIELSRASPVSVVAYNWLGQRVATVFDGSLPPGQHALRWAPAGLATGSYIIMVTVPGGTNSTKALYLR